MKKYLALKKNRFEDHQLGYAGNGYPIPSRHNFQTIWQVDNGTSFARISTFNRHSNASHKPLSDSVVMVTVDWLGTVRGLGVIWEEMDRHETKTKRILRVLCTL